MSESSMNLLTSPIVPSPRLNVSPSQAGRANETYQKPRIKTGLNLATVSRQATGAVEQWYLLVQYLLILLTYEPSKREESRRGKTQIASVTFLRMYVEWTSLELIYFVQLESNRIDLSTVAATVPANNSRASVGRAIIFFVKPLLSRDTHHTTQRHRAYRQHTMYKVSPSPFKGVLTIDAEMSRIPPITEDENDTSDTVPLLSSSSVNPTRSTPNTAQPSSPSPQATIFRSRKASKPLNSSPKNRNRRRRSRKDSLSKDPPSNNNNGNGGNNNNNSRRFFRCCRDRTCRDRTFVRSTLSCMNLVARMLLWCSAVASIAAVVWYSYELRNNGYVSFSLCLPYSVCVCVCVCFVLSCLVSLSHYRFVPIARLLYNLHCI